MKEKLTIGQIVADTKIKKLKDDIHAVQYKVNSMVDILLNLQNLSQEDLMITIDKLKKDVAEKTKELLSVADEVENNLNETYSLVETYYEKSNTDAMTSLFNRTAFDSDIDMFIREDYAFHMISIDMNELKSINDNYGHAS
jgi:diguanylate cyclase